MATSNCTIYVENLPLNISEKLLVKLFTNFGKIKNVELPVFDPEHPICRGLPKPLGKGYALVEFTSAESADKACQLFNSTKFIQDASKQYRGETTTSSCYDESDNQAKPNDEYPIRLAQTILGNLEFRRLLLLRVMPKNVYHELTHKYNDMRLRSLVGAAKLLVVT